MPKVTLLPSGNIIEVDSETNLLEALREKNVYIKSSCGGSASCSDCVIKIHTGEDNVNPPEFQEVQLLGNVFHITKERLSCQLKCTGDITIDISAHNKAADEERLKNKTNSIFANKNAKTRVRKKDEVQAIDQERSDAREEKQVEDGKWEKHWEREKDPLKPKRMGGGKRPQPFRTDHLDEVEAEESKGVAVEGEESKATDTDTSSED